MWIKTFEEYRTRSKSIGDGVSGLKAAIKIYKEKCSDWDLKGEMIYRGNTEGVGYSVMSPKGKYRSSANASNIYNSLFDIIPSWSHVPKRSESLIMTTSEKTAKVYGDIYVMIPFNGTRIGVCPSDDIYNSSPFIDSLVGDENYGFEGFEVEMYDFFVNNINDSEISKTRRKSEVRMDYPRRYLIDITPDNIKMLCDKIDSIPKNELKMEYSYNNKYKYKLMPIWVRDFPNLKLLEFLNYVMDFEKNKFKIITNQSQIPSNQNKGGMWSREGHWGYEVWSDGDFLMIREPLFNLFEMQF